MKGLRDMQKLVIEDIKNVRLWELMQDAEIKEAKSFAKLLYEKGYYTNFRENKNKSDEISDSATQKTKQENNIGALAKIVKRVLYSNEYNNDSFLKACCLFFKCDADYLLERQPLPTKGRTDFNKMTGLSNHAIKILEESEKTYFPLSSYLNFLLEPDNTINDKKELFHRIISYILLSDNIASYEENGVAKMENKNIALCDKYGKAVGTVKTKDMKEAMLLAIITTLNAIKNNVSAADVQHPTIYDCLEQLLDDVLAIDDLKADENALCFTDQLSIYEQRFKENIKRLQYIYGCESIDDIDFKEFKKKFHYKYNDEEIALLKENINL